MDTKRYYLAMYHRYLIELYDNNYISDPTYLNKTEIYSNIKDLEIPYLTDELGIVDLSYESVKAVSDYYNAQNNEEDEDIIIFLNLLTKTIYYKEISDNIDCLFNEGTVRTGGKKRVSLKLSVEDNQLQLLKPYHIDLGILHCFYGLGVPFTKLSVNDFILNLAIKELGCSKNATFVKNFSKQNVIDNLKMVLSGRIPLQGSDGKLLSDWLHNKRDSGFITDNLYDYLVETYALDILTKMDLLISKNPDAIYCDGTSIYLKDEKNTTPKLTYPIGYFVFAQYAVQSGISLAYQWYFNQRHDFEEYAGLLPEKNSILGYTGQVYSKEYLDLNEIDYVGTPIRLYNTEGILEEFVDFEQTELKENETMFAEYETTLDFDGSRPEKEPSKKYQGKEEQILNLYLTKEDGTLDTEITLPRQGLAFTVLHSLAEKIEKDLELGDYAD